MFDFCEFRKFLENEINKSFNITEYLLQGDKMSIKEAYKVLQAEWVKLYNVEVGDTVRVLREPKADELGCYCSVFGRYGKDKMVGGLYKIARTTGNRIRVYQKVGFSVNFPFFCLELVKKAEPKIEITVKVNGKESKLSDISKETLLNLRKETL